jgi:hypothetical protein
LFSGKIPSFKTSTVSPRTTFTSRAYSRKSSGSTCNNGDNGRRGGLYAAAFEESLSPEKIYDHQLSSVAMDFFIDKKALVTSVTSERGSEVDDNDNDDDDDDCDSV